ncbi:LysR family transcriptional regulator [Cohaesibacter sp. ES.047]|uniref:LysR family transcriptional regulator n=1 Tax=Cohaesibacter sp. ES.047 TaxID=1798205 RepID=UPI000BB6999B|nr:LysR family transcriptional regulator [Cohaesibacter sp. ES.047]
MDSLTTLHVFVHAAELRSFTAAGHRLGTSSSAVGKAVARLEERLGVRLFHRSTRAITLTSEGALLLERSRRILGELEAAEAELSQSHATPSGVLRISLPMVGMLLMPALSAFMREWPDIVLDLDFSDRVVDVIEEGFDVVVRTGETGDSRLMTRKVGAFRYSLVGSPSYFGERGVPERPIELADHRCLRHRYPSTGKIEEWLIFDESAGELVDIPCAATASAVDPLLYMAENGLGIACLPDFVVQHGVANGALMRVLGGAVRNTGSFHVLWPSSRYPSPKLRVFIDFMTTRLLSPAM